MVLCFKGGAKLDFSILSDQELTNRTLQAVKEERRVTLEVLRLLHEINHRRLYATLGFSSLYDYAIKGLGYSGGAAYRRIEAMRLIADVPAAAAKVATGTITLSTISAVQDFLRASRKPGGKKYSAPEKAGLLTCMEGKSTREVQKSLASLLPAAAPRQDNVRVLAGGTRTEIRFEADEELMQMLARVKDIMACPGRMTPTYAEIFKKLAHVYLEKKDPATRAGKSAAKISQKPAPEVKNPPCGDSCSAPTPGPRRATPPARSRYVPAHIKRALHARAGMRCEYISPLTGQRCACTRALQYEHVHPFALGGPATLQNMKLLCPAHNTQTAIETFGREHMAKFVKSLA
ncbi:MAG: hypothetical protein A2583_05700 [Bdellovibrionales bacterium RIFOXYD1_FULL_53_11]|nr:MAG: hypothetical protein A2583_05700 [Bdellovibrionales bacterium RIFOXYD1_FULL_53_11]